MTTDSDGDARVDRLRVYPVKSFDGVDVASTAIAEGGTLVGDRRYALFGPDGEPVNGKRTDRVHDLQTSFDLETDSLTVRTDSGERRRFDLRGERSAAEEWFSAFFDLPVTIRRDDETGFVDRRGAGPSVISTATLATVAGWYDDVTVDGLRRRLRANVEISGVPAFWEDRFVGADAPAFVAGDVRFEGVKHCGRCVVPERDPDTGARDRSFRERFLRRRRETLPPWADEDSFDHYYAVMLVADVPLGSRGDSLRVGDPVRIVD